MQEKTVLVRNLKRFGEGPASQLRTAGEQEGRYLRVPLSLYESARRGELGGEVIPDAYDPASHRYVGRCCS